MNIDAMLSLLLASAIEHKTEYSLRDRVSFKLDCTADVAIFPRSADELITASSICRDTACPCVLLGRGSNLFFARTRYEGAVILTERMNGVEREGSVLCVSCGTPLTSLAVKAAKMGLSGLEFAYGIPGSVGGAVFMNAGAYGGAMADVLVESTAYDCETGETLVLHDHDFGYRTSIYMKKPSLVCLEARFQLGAGNPAAIEEEMRAHMQSRRQNQPLEYPSAGSYFKRPAEHFAGKLIEDCGLKGLRVGGAEVSEKHAGFLINRGGATAADVLALEEKVRNAVKERFGIVLEREVRVVE